MKYQKRITVYCTNCKEDIDERKTTFVNIEEDFQGWDVLTFICPKCKTTQSAYRRG
jgi:Zn finger protein HypA/HybF involved in hydrogenase expression